MRIKPQIDNTIVTLNGSFNPAIFQPAWFVRHGMLGEKEAENPENILQTDQELRFKAGKFEIHVARDGFAVSNFDSHCELVRDLVVSCFGNLLPHTPVRSVLIRRFIHFDAGTSEAVEHLRTLLVPKEPWSGWCGEINKSPQNSSVYGSGGMVSVTVCRQMEFDKGDIYVFAKVEPSFHISSGTGIFVEAANRFEFAGGQSIQDASLGVHVLKENWESSLKRSEEIFDDIMKLTEVSESDDN